MKSIQFLLRSVALSLLFTAALAQAASVTGTVTNKTTGKPATGDSVVLVDVQAGMGEVARATTDAQGHYSLAKPGSSNYLVRVTHQGAPYFIAAPEGGASGDIQVYDVAAKVDGVSIDEDVLGIETDNAQLHVVERYIVRNTSMPPRTQWRQRSFQIVLPEEAIVQGVSGQRPTSGMPTNIKLDPDGPKGHYSFNFPIQPDNGDKATLFQIEYTVPYGEGKFTFHPQVSIPARTVWVVLPKSMNLASGGDSAFQSSPQDPGVQTFVSRSAIPGKALEFTVSGSGSLPRDTEGSGGQQAGAGMGANGSDDAGAAGGKPGGGIGNPINTPDPLTKYKWWILAGLALLLAAAAAFLLRKQPGAPVVAAVQNSGAQPFVPATPASRNASLLSVLKEELFSLESDKISGTISAADYTEVKAALETVLKRALKKSS
jgi:hypothetical protein